MDRRYRQAQGASKAPIARREAYARSQRAAVNRQNRTFNSEAIGYESGPKGIDGPSGWRVSAARAEDRRSTSDVFKDKGAAAYDGLQGYDDLSPEAGIRSRSRGSALTVS